MPRRSHLTRRAFWSRSTPVALLTLLGLLQPPAVAAAVAPRLALLPSAGPPTTEVIIGGTGFGSSERVDLAVGDVRVGTVEASSAGRFSAQATVPASARPGPLLVSATGQTGGESAVATFTVRTDWPMLGFEPHRTSFNPYENILNPSNVGGLTLRWRVGSYFGTPVVSGGVIYSVIGLYNQLTALDERTGQILWQTQLSGTGNPAAPVVEHGVVYTTNSSGTMYAVNALTGSIIWAAPAPTTYGVTLAVWRGRAYSVSLHEIAALEEATGRELWRYRDGDSEFWTEVGGYWILFLTGCRRRSLDLAEPRGTGRVRTPGFLRPRWREGAK